MPRTRAFTLIELLMVMGIIAILAALLLSVIGHCQSLGASDHLPEQSQAMGNGHTTLCGGSW